MIFANSQRFRSLTEIENYRNVSGDLKIPIFDKKTSDFCFEKSREIFSKPFSVNLKPSKLDPNTFDKATRDLIGDNLLEIEKTLNALNLDFLQAFHEIDKTDSTETLFDQNFLFENNLKKESLVKNMSNFQKLTGDSKDDSMTLGSLRDNISDPKAIPNYLDRTSTSDPHDTTTSSQKKFFNFDLEKKSFLYSSPTKRTLINSQIANKMNKYEESIQGPQQRYRSLSFTENLEVKSPMSANSEFGRNNLGQKLVNEVKKTGSLDEEKSENNFVSYAQSKPAGGSRNVITYKPKSKRARNLRRLSYNPLNMINMSSSSSESDLDRSMAHSDCDIRSKYYPGSFQRRRQQYLNSYKKHGSETTGLYDQNVVCGDQGSNNNSLTFSKYTKMYGSNASIKSAPQYSMNYHKIVANRDNSGLDSDSDLGCDLSTRKKRPFKKPQLTPSPPKLSLNFNNVCEFSGKGLGRSFTLTQSDRSRPNMTKKVMQDSYRNIKERKSTSNFNLLYSDFDTSKLTGKSPTTPSYFDVLDNANIIKAKSNNERNAFQWPDKILGSTVKQNDLIRQLQQQHDKDKQERGLNSELFFKRNRNSKKLNYSSDSMSTEYDSLAFTRDYLPLSPAP